MNDNNYCTEEPSFHEEEVETAPGFLELVYGVLFEPSKTFKKATLNPPLGSALILVAIMGLAGVLMWVSAISIILDQAAGVARLGSFTSTRPVLVLGAFLIFLWGFIKWLSYSAFISLAAELLGGVGRARSTAAVVGLSLLPTILTIPVQMLSQHLDSPVFIVITVITVLGVWVWATALMVIGMREVHGLSTGRSLLAVISPVLVLVVFICLLTAGMIALAASMLSEMNLPGYF